MLEASTISTARIVRVQPRLEYQVMTREAASQRAADEIMEVARRGRGTVLTPGCNTPKLMYQRLFVTGALELAPLLRGERGDFAMGMIDGVEWQVEHPYSFPYYFIDRFLARFALAPLNSIADPQERAALIEHTYSLFKHVYVPHIPKDADPEAKLSALEEFNSWLYQRLPIDLLVLGLGPDGHIAFLGPGTDIKELESPACWISLWEGIRNWKWLKSSDEACECVREGCDIEVDAPESALTISLSTVISARKIILMAFGQGKAAAVRQLLNGNYRPEQFTAHYLAEVKNKVTVLLDEPAASLL